MRHLSPKDLKRIRKQLENRRRALMRLEEDLEEEGLLGYSEEEIGEISHVRWHPADLGTEENERDTALTLTESQIHEIQEIDGALQRMETETFGICENCGREIPIVRLEAMPYARHCAVCANILERERRLKAEARHSRYE